MGSELCSFVYSAKAWPLTSRYVSQPPSFPECPFPGHTNEKHLATLIFHKDHNYFKHQALHYLSHKSLRMPPIRGKKRKSVESTMSNDEELQQNAAVDIAMGQTVPTKTGSPTTSEESPCKKMKTGITLAQKQALIDNLQLESMFPAQRSMRRGKRVRGDGLIM